MRYGGIEWTYAEPIARALVESRDFRCWFLQQTRFSEHAEEAVLLNEEMQARRAASAETWWRSHFTEKCRCPGCSGQETDLLAVFARGSFRFAIHVEVKRPGDKFPKQKDQAHNYSLRAQCWARRPPSAILPHHDADTMLIFSKSQQEEFAPHRAKFGASATFEAISRALPQGMCLPAVC